MIPPRLPAIGPNDPDDDRRALWREVTSGDRAAAIGDVDMLPGPFNPWMYCPRPAIHAARLGEALRASNALSRRAQEVAILTTAVHFRSSFVERSHRRVYARLGGGPTVPDCVASGQPLDGCGADDDERAAHAFARALLSQGSIDDDLFARCESALGPDALAELVMIVGYYSLVSLTVVAFDVDQP